MFDDYLDHIVPALRTTAFDVMIGALVFVGVAFLFQGRKVLHDVRRAWTESKTNFSWVMVDAVLMMPLITISSHGILALVEAWSLNIISPTNLLHAVTPEGLEFLVRPTVITLAVILSDFFGYWRHRLEHSRWFWPAHAIHHSDQEMTWLTLWRNHPLNRLVTMLLDIIPMALLGFPLEAIIVGSLLRHYSGLLTHANLPWTFGRWGQILVSPAMHRWHHARDERYLNKNFANLFAIFDRMFGTYHMPGPCNEPLGIKEHDGPGAWRQFTYPFKVWLSAIRRHRDRQAPQPGD